MLTVALYLLAPPAACPTSLSVPHKDLSAITASPPLAHCSHVEQDYHKHSSPFVATKPWEVVACQSYGQKPLHSALDTEPSPGADDTSIGAPHQPYCGESRDATPAQLGLGQPGLEWHLSWMSPPHPHPHMRSVTRHRDQSNIGTVSQSTVMPHTYYGTCYSSLLR